MRNSTPRPPASLTLSLDRAMGLLERVAVAPRAGISLTELAQASGLSMATTHRLLVGLKGHGLVDYEAAARRFRPGLKLFRMGLAAAARFDVVELAAPTMVRLAEETGDTIYLSLRSGDDAMCVARTVGAFPIKTLTLNVGDCRPLGLGAGSLALLASLPDAEIDLITKRNRDRLAPYPHFNAAGLKKLIARTRRDGYSLNEGLMLPEMSAIGMPVRGGGGAVVAALSVAAINSRMRGARRESLLRMLAREAGALRDRLGGGGRERAAA